MTDPVSTPIPTPSPTLTSFANSYDTVVKANKIKIKKINSYEYEIKIIKSNNALIYQVFDKDSSTLNNNRRILSVPLLKWRFYEYVWNKGKPTDIPFTPTTVMEIGNKKYVFVINNTIIKEGKIIFQVSTKDIKYGNLNKLSKIKKGQFKNVRFDIDSKTWTVASCTQTFSSNGGASCNKDDCNKWANWSRYPPPSYESSSVYGCPVDDGSQTTFDPVCGECCYVGTTGNWGCIDEGNGA